MAGQVRVDGQIVFKPATAFLSGVDLNLDSGPRFVSRGGEKLEAALQAFPIDPQGCTVADVGVSTGGFSDCLLQHGAAKIYAIDVGKGVLHWKLRSDPRVVVMESTNARHVQALPEAVQWVTIDASFISLKILLPVVRHWLSLVNGQHQGEVLALVKPQFEAGRKESAKGQGVIRDPELHRRILLDVLSFADQAGFGVMGLIRSPLLGPKGNTEFLAWLRPHEAGESLENLVETLGLRS